MSTDEWIADGWRNPPAEVDCADYELHRTRALSRQCETCIYRPGNPVMNEQRCLAFEREVLADNRFIPCHSTYEPLGRGPGAVCRGFYIRNRGRGVLAAIDRLWGFVFVDPPNDTP